MLVVCKFPTTTVQGKLTKRHITLHLSNCLVKINLKIVQCGILQYHWYQCCIVFLFICYFLSRYIWYIYWCANITLFLPVQSVPQFRHRLIRYQVYVIGSTVEHLSSTHLYNANFYTVHPCLGPRIDVGLICLL